MKKTISILIVLVMLVIAIAGCGTNEQQQQSPQPTGTVISNSEQQNNDEYEDALFADAAQLLNSKDYVAAHEIAEQSISGKCKDAVMYVTLNDFALEYVAEEIFGAMNEVVVSMTDAVKRSVEEKDRNILNSASTEGLEKIAPLFDLQTEIPKDILPEEAEALYDEYYLQALSDLKKVLENLPDALDENWQTNSEFYNLALPLGNYNEEGLILKLAQALMYFDGGKYTLPDEYQQLLVKQYGRENINTENDILKSDDKTEEVSATPAEPTAEPTPEHVTMPLEIEGIRYDTNSIGTPEIYIRVKNTGDATIDAFDFAVKCLNNYGETVKGYGREPYSVCTYQGEGGNIGAGEVWSASENDFCWTMYGYDTATNYEVAIIKVHTTDGETITLNQNQYEWIPQNE